ncbi:MAG TPA: putative quinol monooxygenase [Methylomirabilota bacterium]|nr:putative quinol monooxygenase [Methylomirabilota bacterium]
MIHVLATIELRPGRRDAFLRAFRNVLPAIRAEAGCVEYTPALERATGIPLQSPARDHVVMVMEKWRDLAALEAHLGAPHVVAFLRQHQEAIASVTLQILEAA